MIDRYLRFVAGWFFVVSISVGAGAARGTEGIIIQLKEAASRGGPRLGRVAAATGIPRLDSLNRQFGCVSFKRLMRARPAHGALSAQHGLDRLYHLRFDESVAASSVVAAYAGLECVEYVEPNGTMQAQGSAAIYPNDPYFSWLWGLNNGATFGFGDRWDPKPDADIDAPEAWGITQGDSGVLVAILDSGCKTDHPELVGRFWRNPAEVPGNGVDDDGNGFVDDVLGCDIVDGDGMPRDTFGHGTRVTGVLAANANNELGHVGVDWYCKVMVVKIMDPLGGTNFTDVVEGIQYAVDNGADVINMSFGGARASRAVSSAVDYAAAQRVVMVAAVGNDNVEQLLYPAAYAPVIAVGSSDPDDRRSDLFGSDTSLHIGSNYGVGIDVVAPGNNIFLLSLTDDTLFTEGNAGTSLATPYVTGIASLLLAHDPSLSPDSIRTIIRASADDLVGDPAEDAPGYDKYMGYGRVSAWQALTYGETTTARRSPRDIARVQAWRERGHFVVTGLGDASVKVSLVSLSGRGIALVEGGDTHAGRRTFVMPPSLAPGTYALVVRTGSFESVSRVAVSSGVPIGGVTGVDTHR